MTGSAVRFALTTLAALGAAQAQAAAFQLREGSAATIGTALAGRTSGDRDVSYSFHNPASLRGVKNFEISLGGAVIIPGGDARATGGAPGFNRTDDPGETAFLPSLTLGYRVLPDLILGLVVDVPFGLATEYSSRFAGSPDGVRSELTTITVTPQLAYELTPELTIGAGVMIQYADAELTNFGPTGQVIGVEGDGWDIGWTFGMLAEPYPGTKLGLAVQSGFSHTLEGHFTNNFPGRGGNPGEARFDLPPIVSVGMTQQLGEKWRVMGEFEWTGWSAFDSIKISDTRTGTLVIDDEQNYRNSFMIAAGAEYDWSDRLTLRAGAAYDKTPTRDAFRTVRVPDGDRIWLAAGASYEITERIGVDAAYLYILIDDTTVNLRNVPGRVSYSNSDVHLLTANLRYRF